MKTIYEMKSEELRIIAKEHKMPGAWKAKKSEMIAFLEGIGYNAIRIDQNEPESTKQVESDNYKTENEEALKPAQELSNEDYTIAAKNSNGSTTVIAEVHHKDIVQNEPEQLQNEPESTKQVESDNLSDKEENAPERTVGLKNYAAWVVDRETKEITTVVGEAESREEFYRSIKGEYRVRLITKPEKIEEECKQWEIRHAQNKIKKNEKYAADKIEATKMNMNVAEYRKWLRAFNSQ